MKPMFLRKGNAGSEDKWSSCQVEDEGTTEKSGRVIAP